MKRILGIEGGASKSEWIYLQQSGDEWNTIAQGLLPPANVRLVTSEELTQILKMLPADVSHAGVFLAGCITEQDRQNVANAAARVWPKAAVAVGSDRDSSMAAAFGEGDGVAVISGTGSAVTGRKNGRFERAGGRGHLLGDRGGAYVICIEGLRLALRHYDLNHQTSPLAQEILSALNLNTMEDLIVWVQGAHKDSIGSLAPVLFEAARSGDTEMTAVIQAGAHALATYSASVIRWLDFLLPPVRLLGGLFLHQPMYVDLYRSYLSEMVQTESVEVCRTPGAVGAAWLASADGSRVPRITPPASAPAQELDSASTEESNPRSVDLDRMDTRQLVELFLGEEKYVGEALKACSDPMQKAVELVVTALQNGGRVFYVGAGTSGRLGVLDATEIPPTFGEPPGRFQGIIAGGSRALYQSVEGAEDDQQGAELTMVARGVRSADVACGISASGRTPFVLAALRKAKTLGAATMLITCNPARQQDVSCDVEIDIPTGPELITGSTRLKAGTATKVALNILSSCAMIRLGRVVGNLMVDVNPSNSKLRYRAVRLVSKLRGCSRQEAEKLLQSSNWNIRKALES